MKAVDHLLDKLTVLHRMRGQAPNELTIRSLDAQIEKSAGKLRAMVGTEDAPWLRLVKLEEDRRCTRARYRKALLQEDDDGEARALIHLMSLDEQIEATGDEVDAIFSPEATE